MARHSAEELRKNLFEAERDAVKRKEVVAYYLVTNPEIFSEGLSHILRRKEEVLASQNGKAFGKQRLLVRRRDAIYSALYSTNDNTPSIKPVGNAPKEGTVDLIEIPIVERSFLEVTPFEDSQKPMMLFRCMGARGKDTSWAEGLTGLDLQYLTQEGNRVYRGEVPALVKLEEVFVNAREGTDLVAARKLLDKKHTNAALKRLRHVGEFTLSSWIQTRFLEEGREFSEPKERTYLDYAFAEGLISTSDRIQGKAFMFAGNAAIHHSLLAYHGLSAVLFLDWLDDFVGKTIGHHTLPKETANGTSNSEVYTIVTDPAEYRLRRAIADQFHYMVRRERENSASQWVRTQEGQSVEKRIVMSAAVDIVGMLTKKGARFCEADERFCEVLNYWRKNLDKPEAYTRQDAVRAALFAAESVYTSKETNLEDRLGGKTHPRNLLDPTIVYAVWKKGRGNRRYESMNLQEDFEATLAEQLEVVKKVTRTYFPESLDRPQSETIPPVDTMAPAKMKMGISWRGPAY